MWNEIVALASVFVLVFFGLPSAGKMYRGHPIPLSSFFFLALAATAFVWAMGCLGGH